jgi:hypothetical protein
MSEELYAHHGHSIRIVPLHVPDALHQPTEEAAAAGPAPVPHLTYRHGPLLSAVQVVTIFWGPAWHGAQAALVPQLNQFFDFILTSPLIAELHQYSVPGFPIGNGHRIGTTTITAPALGNSVSDSTIQHVLQQLLATNAVPHPTTNTLYFFYIQPGVRVVMGGSASCQAFCGYHSDLAGHIFYAVMPFPGCAGCTGGLSVFDALTSTSSHELCEAITDPVPGSGWYDNNFGEIGDICAWKTKKIGQYTVQLEWSNAANNCI